MSAPVPVVTLVAGFDQALYRFATHDGGVNPSSAERAYLALFEVLNWLHAIDDRLQHDWPGERQEREHWYRAFEAGRTLPGVRYARNRVHHQWADAIAGMRVGSFAGLREGTVPDPPLVRPLRGEFRDPIGEAGRWRWVAELPPAERPDREGQDAYRDRLAGRLVRETFDELAILFASVAESFKNPHT